MVSYKRNRKKKHRRTRRKRYVQRGAASNSAVVFNIHGGSGYGPGFASVFNFLCRVYIYAKETGQDFFIEHSPNWRYLYKNGWHDYFKTLKMYDPAIKYAEVKKFSHGQTGDIPEYTLNQYTDCIKEILVLNDDLEKRVQDCIASMSGNYKSIYIRRGDKTSGIKKENEAINIPELLGMTDISKDDKVFIQTDDYKAVEEIKQILPPENVFTLTPPENNGADTMLMAEWPPEKKKKHAEELFISFMVCVRASRGWTDNRSNLGRLHKMYAPDTFILYPIDPKSQNIHGNMKIDPGWRTLVNVENAT
jgi:hypothetical protein